MNALSAIESKLPANERMLQDALRRAVNAQAGIAMLVLHAANLPGAAAHPHRAKLARAVLDDCAEQVEGEVYRLTNGDLVLLARRPGDKLGPTGLTGHPSAACSITRRRTAVGTSLGGRSPNPPTMPPPMSMPVSPMRRTCRPVLTSPPLAQSEWPGSVLAAGPVWDLLTRHTAVRLPDAAAHRLATQRAAGTLTPLQPFPGLLGGHAAGPRATALCRY